jgi:hypothetical protein
VPRRPADRRLRADSPPRLLLLCPLDFERAVLEGLQQEQHGVELPADAALEVCGPGRAGVDRWFASRGESACPASLGVLLVGTAGGLRPDLPAGSAIIAERIVEASQRTWTPTFEALLANEREVRRATVLALEEAVLSPADKARHHAATIACAVDLESAAFAEHCEARGWRWGVVRGISDAAGDALPREVSSWVDARGRLRPFALLGSLARRPRTIAALPGLRRRSVASLRAAASIVARIGAVSTPIAEPIP